MEESKETEAFIFSTQVKAVIDFRTQVIVTQGYLIVFIDTVITILVFELQIARANFRQILFNLALINFFLTLIDTFHFVTEYLAYRMSGTFLIIVRTINFVHFYDFISAERELSSQLIAERADTVAPVSAQINAIRVHDTIINLRSSKTKYC